MPPKKCPVCDGTDLSPRSHPGNFDGVVYQNMECENCGATWTNIFRFSTIQDVEKP